MHNVQCNYVLGHRLLTNILDINVKTCTNQPKSEHNAKVLIEVESRPNFINKPRRV
jgi:hypothetical protein